MSMQKQTAVSGIIDTIKTLLIAGMIAIGFRSFVAEPFNIPSGSMIPSLLVGDYLFVTKYSYGYSRYSFPFGIAPIQDRVLAGDRKPQRGQVAVFGCLQIHLLIILNGWLVFPGTRYRSGVAFCISTVNQLCDA